MSLLDMKTFFKIIALSLFFTVLSTFFNTKNYFENDVYVNYSKSFVQDLDLNIINQYTHPADTWLVTETNQHPDFHFFTISSILVPFELLTKVLGLQDENINKLLFNFVSFYIVTLCCFWLKEYLLTKYQIESKYFTKGLVFYLMASSAWLLTLENVFLPDIVITLFALLSFKIVNDDIEFAHGPKKYLFLGFLAIFKTELLIFNTILIIQKFINQKKIEKWSFLYFIMPLFYCFYRFTQSGDFSLLPMLPISSLISFLNFGWTKLFYLDGLFFYSPIYLVVLWISYKNIKNEFSVIFFSLVFIAVGICSGPVVVVINFFDRHFLFLMPLIIALLAKSFKNGTLKVSNTLPVILFSIWAKIIFFSSNLDLMGWGVWDSRFTIENFLMKFGGFDSFLKSFDFINGTRDVIILIVLVFFSCLILYFIFFSKKIILYFTLVMFISMISTHFYVSNKSPYESVEFVSVCKGSGCFYDDFVDVYEVGIAQMEKTNVNSKIVDALKEKFKTDKRKILNNIKLSKEDSVCFENGGYRSSFWKIKKMPVYGQYCQ